MTELELITALGAHDAVLDDLDKKIAAQEAREPDALEQVAAAEQELAKAQAAHKASKDAERALSRQVKLYEQRRTTATRALEGGHGDPDAAERQIAQCTEILDDLETQQLEQMEQTEAADEAIRQARAKIDEAQEVLATAREQALPELQRLRSARAAEQSKRDAIWEPIPTEVQNRYALIRKKRKTAVSKMVDGYCSACRKKVPLGEGAEIRKGLLRSCSNCGRYLVLPS